MFERVFFVIGYVNPNWIRFQNSDFVSIQIIFSNNKVRTQIANKYVIIFKYLFLKKTKLPFKTPVSWHLNYIWQ